ncbi:MAG TPA: tetratricopeptide repeat protein [Verrucomicrobiae bacterium]|nr:tetratricopeptide repeat protein [Verrucomicrobiae bacterium]
MALSVLLLSGGGCGKDARLAAQSRQAPPAQPAQPALAVLPIDPLTLVLMPPAGETRLDAEIREQQGRLGAGAISEDALERLGWLFVAKARSSFDAGYYRLAEQCALLMVQRQPGSQASQLLRGHALHSQHRFHEAAGLARALVNGRGLSFDFGLLGDVLVDLGQVEEGARAYQSMLDLKPDPQGYARAGHIRWLKGDLAGALEVLGMAARSSRDPESAAWIHTQLGRYLWQAQAPSEARRALEVALTFQPDYAPALLWRGRMLLSEGASEQAIALLRRAVQSNPLPEYHWTLAEAFRAANREPEARAAEHELAKHAAFTDPRTYSLYLATRNEQVETAVQLAELELEERADIFTQDALAWALAAAGHFEEAHARMANALSEGTQDARLYFHATVIAVGAARMDEAKGWLTKAAALSSMLLPAELTHLQAAADCLGAPRLKPKVGARSAASPLSGTSSSGAPHGSPRRS